MQPLLFMQVTPCRQRLTLHQTSMAFATFAPCHRRAPLVPRDVCHSRRRALHSAASRANVTMSMSPSTPTSDSAPKPNRDVSRPPSPLLPPDFVLTNRLTAAMYTLFSKQGATLPAFSAMLDPDIYWDMPLFTSRSRKEAAEILTQFFAFAIDSTIAIYSVTYDSSDEQKEKQICSFHFEWTLSFLYPLPWRPRVCVSGQSQVLLSLSTGFVERVEESWDVPPVTLIQQALPRLRDILWLFPGPPPETDKGTRRMLQKATKKRPYAVISLAPRAEFSVISNVNQNEREALYVTPAFPEDAYEGLLRRLEFYCTVAPVSVRYAGGDDFEFMVPAPGGHVGSSNVLLKYPLAKGASIKIQPRRVFATYRFAGFSTRTNTEAELQKFIKVLRADGLWEGDLLASDVWVRTYDNFVGFNSKGLLAISMYGNSKFIRRTNEIAIDITDNWEAIAQAR